MSYKTSNWVIGILVGAFIASAVVGYLHVAELISEPSSQLLHALKDWVLIVIFLLPI